MASASKPRKTVTVNRAAVLTLWAAVVARRLGFDRDEALTLGRAVAGLNAQSKGRRLGIFRPGRESAARKRKGLKDGEKVRVELLHRAVPVVRTAKGLRALAGSRATEPASVERYLEQKFGEALGDARRAMAALARSRSREEIEDEAYGLYERFRPAIPAGKKGWGAKGRLDLERIRRMARD